eukprot:m.49567 g.49567  ORF g.49567 m.49567 type:complete len:109 (+) comp12481_c0_seq3:299-625(+)
MEPHMQIHNFFFFFKEQHNENKSLRCCLRNSLHGPDSRCSCFVLFLSFHFFLSFLLLVCFYLAGLFKGSPTGLLSSAEVPIKFEPLDPFLETPILTSEVALSEPSNAS